MRAAEKIVAALIAALCLWTLVMAAATILQFKGEQRNRILLVELGSDAASLKLAVHADSASDSEGVARNKALVLRNTYMDFLFIVLYWLTYVSLAYLAGLLGNRFLAAISALLISVAAVFDVLENGAIVVAMNGRTFTDADAVNIWSYSQSKWIFFFLATFVLGLAMCLNNRVSLLRRICGAVFVSSGLLGLLGIARNTTSLSFAISMINLGTLLIAVALLLTLWKVVQSLRELEVRRNPHREHALYS